jgi:hypothetical protein
MKYVLDTHTLIWFLEGNLKLGANAKTILCDGNSQLVIPATTLAEAVWIVERGRTSIPNPKDVILAVESDPRVVIYPLLPRVVFFGQSAGRVGLEDFLQALRGHEPPLPHVVLAFFEYCCTDLVGLTVFSRTPEGKTSEDGALTIPTFVTPSAVCYMRKESTSP